MNTTAIPLNLLSVSVVDWRHDFIQTHKKELIGIGVVIGLILLVGIYRLFKRPSTAVQKQIIPGQPQGTTVIIQQQQQPPPQQQPSAVAPTTIQVRQQQRPQQKPQSSAVAPSTTQMRPQQRPQQSSAVAPSTAQMRTQQRPQQKQQSSAVAPSTAQMRPQQRLPQALKTKKRKPTQIQKSQQKPPKFPRLEKATQIKANLPSTGNIVSTGFSNQFAPKQ